MDATHEQLIARLIDDPSNADAWQAFEQASVDEPTLWRDLAESQRCQAALSDAVNSATSVAMFVDTPPQQGVVGRLGSWSGWGVAAIVTFMLFWSIAAPNTDETPMGGTDIQTAGWTTDQFKDMYLQRGQEEGTVIRELPTKVLLEATPVEVGGARQFTVVFIRPILERRTVGDLIEYMPQGESGDTSRVRLTNQPY